jgi:hypothetical protein
MGNFMSANPNTAALSAGEDLVDCGVFYEKIDSEYRLGGHKDASGSNTACPGDKLYETIQDWDYYNSDM